MTELINVFKDKFMNGSETHREQVKTLTSIVFEEDGFFGSKVKNLLEELDQKEGELNEKVDDPR